MVKQLIQLAEKGILPDSMIRLGIKNLNRIRLNRAKEMEREVLEMEQQVWLETLKDSPVALVPEKANEQHYEVPPEFFELVLENI